MIRRVPPPATTAMTPIPVPTMGTMTTLLWIQVGDWDHLDELDAKLDVSREEHIFGTTLLGRTSYMEPNMFPYDPPEGIEHWTLWSRLEMNHDDVKAYVESWIDTNAPHVQAWNYDDNPERSINIFHVHVYLQVASSSTKNSVLQGRPVESLTH
ncbi:hypothetical protein DYB25_001745 [Aphanomyces astaci]|uniref:Uncharacterized protein n=1 Tax=Aphanomyces astaci TaxID=112090 RepID=A0A397BJU4_APHAT|nr:hypothetical protein DYB25_001745 [Aphanomyces astaci]